MTRAPMLMLLLLFQLTFAAKTMQIMPSPLSNSRVALRFSNPSRAGTTKPVVGDVSALAHSSQPSPIAAHAMPLVHIDATNQTLSLDHTALHALAAAPAPVCVATMTGTARDGKSTFLNMFSQWLQSRWSAEGGQGAVFPVGHELDTCTDGAWMRIFHGRDGQPLPGTECSSVVLVDTQGLAKGSALGVHRLFSFSLLLSSTVSLNVMRQFNDDTLDRLGAATTHAMSLLERSSFGEHSPNLFVLLRDARLRMTQAGRSISPDGMLHAALQPAADGLDSTRKAIRSFFSNHTMVQMRQPDSDDLKHLENRGFPPRNRPFYASFSTAAEHLAGALQPKVVNNALLSGKMLATTAASLVEQLNEGVQLSLSSTVDAVQHDQASQAVAAGLRSFRVQLPEVVRRVGMDDSPLNGAALALSPGAIDFRLQNATQAAVAEFAKQAPNMGSRERLQPYVDQLRVSLQAMQRELKQAHEQALRLSAVHASQAQLREEHATQRDFIRSLLQQQKDAREMRFQELLGNVAVVALGASAVLLPPGLISRMAPVVRNAPIALSVLGVWRVAQRSVRKVASLALNAVNGILPATEPQRANMESVRAADPVAPAFG